MTDILGYYFSAHITLSLCFLVLWLAKKSFNIINFQALLKLSYALILAALIIPAVLKLNTQVNPFGPIVKVWTESSAPSAAALPTFEFHVSRDIIGAPVKTSLPMGYGIAFGLALLLLLLVQAMRFRSGFVRINRILDSSFIFKSIGKTNVWLCDEIASPFSFYDGQAHIVLPYQIIDDPQKLKMAVAHEAQHHRQWDTRWVYFYELVYLVFAVNPFIKKLNNLIIELQELACDESLVGRENFSAQAYGNCLYDFAKQQLSKSAIPIGAIGMAAEAKLLKRRIEMIFHERKTSSCALIIALALGLTAMTTAAWALDGAVSGKKLSLQQAESYAARASQNSEIPIVVDQAVLKWLNQAIDSEKHKSFMRQALGRMNEHLPMVHSKLSEGGLPLELAAVPIPESSYRNNARSPAKAVGIWQFIPTTARRCGLRVDDQVDERLNPIKHTDAAVCYYQKLNAIFNNWHAAIAAYNIGEHRMLRAIYKHGHNDILRLAREGHLGKEGGSYLPKVLAAMIIVKNPELLD